MTKKLGKYEIIKEIGKGAMGVVYLAFDPVIERQVAIKTMNDESFSDSEQRARFFREAKSAGGLQHPNIVTIYDMGESEGTPYIVMEFVEGDDLDELIAQGTLKLKDKLNIMIQLCEALSFAHSQGIIHRDIKPSNIRVLKDKKIKVMDFGIAKRQDSDLTRTGLVVGTISYMSPEQIQGKPITAASDQFSAGTVFYQLMTGKKPFEGENITSVIFKIISLKPETLDMSGVEPFVANVIKKMMANDVAHRFKDCHDVAETLRAELISLSTGKNNIKTEVISAKTAGLPPIPTDKTVKTEIPKPPVKNRQSVGKKKKKAPVAVILIIVFVVVVLAGVGGFFAFKKIKRVVKKRLNPKTEKVVNNKENNKNEVNVQSNNDNKDNTLANKYQDIKDSKTLANGENLVNQKVADQNANNLTSSAVSKLSQESEKEIVKNIDNAIKKQPRKKEAVLQNNVPIRKRRPKKLMPKEKEIFVKKGGQKVTVKEFGAFNEFQPLINRSKRQAMAMQGPQRKAKSNQFFNKGRTYFGNRAYKAAALNFYLSTVYDPTNSHAYANLIISLEKLKAYAEAEKVLKQASKHGISVSEMMQNVMFRESYEKILSNR